MDTHGMHRRPIKQGNKIEKERLEKKKEKKKSEAN